ncbi:MAG: SBBP repeat-containing protein, partial [Chitinophagales bacterium]
MNQRVCLLIAICLSTFSYAQQANFEWAKSFGGTFDDQGYSIALDASGNVYTTGWFAGTVDFDPGAGTNNLTAQGSADVFVQKLDPLGNLIWAKSFGGTSADQGYSIALDASGNVYTTGRFRGTVDFDPGAGLATLTSAGSDDVFIQKLDPLGNLIWAKSFGGTSADYGYSIAVDASGNVYTTGYFQGTVDFDPGAGTNNLTAQGNRDVFIQKLDPLGN